MKPPGALVYLLIVVGCGYLPGKFEEVPAEPPLATLQISRHRQTEEVFAKLLPGREYSEFVPLELFGGFTRGITAEQAGAAFGPPESFEAREYSESSFWTVESGRIEVMKVLASEGTWWDLRLYPKSLGVEDVIPTQLVELVDRSLERSRIVLRTDGRAGGVIVNLELGKLSYISPIPKDG